MAITVRFKGKDGGKIGPFGRRSGECFYRNWLDFGSTQNAVWMFKTNPILLNYFIAPRF
jgi:hypothetical protein